MGLRDFTAGTGNGNGIPNNNNGSGTPLGTPPGSMCGANPAGNSMDPLDYLINYNDQFANAGPTLFREQVICQTLSVLLGKNKPNALLVGPAGVGKTKIAEDIAYRIATKDPIIPDKLADCTIYELPLSILVSGSRYVGDVEEKTKLVLDFLSDPANKAIVFIDEIHMLLGDNQTYDKIAQIMKPALSRGKIRTIGATTLQEANKLMDDPALCRRFSRVIVDEFTQEQTEKILIDMKPVFFRHYGNKIQLDDKVLAAVVKIADEYKPAGSHRPDSAITLLDRACGDAVVDLKLKLSQNQNNPTVTQALLSTPLIPVTINRVKNTAVKIMTGNAEKLGFDKDAMLAALAPIKGQDNVIDKLIRLLRQYDLDLFPREVPLTILFAGASGVGKTEITKLVAKEMTGVKPIILNMTEYHSSASINRIIGSPAGYVGSTSNQELPFDNLESNPYQVILLDEFEKADRSVQRLFMSAFDEGYIKTNRGKLIDFSRSIIIATTNAGGQGRKPMGFDNGTSKTNSAGTVARSMKGAFDTELLNRFQSVIEFNPLSEDIYREILQNQYHTEVARIKATRPRISILDDIPDDKLDEIVAETFIPEFGARPARKAVREYIESQV